MSDLQNEKRDTLAQEMGWTIERAQGYIDGEASQVSGLDMSVSHKVAMDEYSKGYRTGYYTRACSVSITVIREALSAH